MLQSGHGQSVEIGLGMGKTLPGVSWFLKGESVQRLVSNANAQSLGGQPTATLLISCKIRGDFIASCTLHRASQSVL